MTKTMKWTSIAALLLALVWRSSAGYEILLQFVVCVSALLVMWQAGWASPYFLAAFTAIAVLFNPIAPIPLSATAFAWLDLTCVVMFMVSLGANQSRLAVSSVTGQ